MLGSPGPCEGRAHSAFSKGSAPDHSGGLLPPSGARHPSHLCSPCLWRAWPDAFHRVRVTENENPVLPCLLLGGLPWLHRQLR